MSEDQQYLQSEYQRRWEMLQNRVMPENNRQSFPTEPNATNIVASLAARVPPPTTYCSKTNATKQERTFEQVYKDVLEKQLMHKNVVPPRSKPRTVAVEPAPSTSRKQHDTPYVGMQKSDYNRRQQDIYRVLQLHQEQRRNGEPVLVTKHRTNVMLTIIKPKVTSPAPSHVYGAPDITTPNHSNQPVQYTAQESYADHRLLNMPRVASSIPTEPPPAHRIAKESSKSNFVTTPSNTSSIITKPVDQGQSQVEALNLDTKHETATCSRFTANPSSSFLPTASTSAPSSLPQAMANTTSNTKESCIPKVVKRIADMPASIDICECFVLNCHKFTITYVQ
uniref:Uncharacterized protein n=1 Tax=Anopheles culicifacies TaxID=139723 RepID=A0A182LXB3_9DIPT